MSNNTSSEPKTQFLLLKELVWKIDDKLKVIIETQADHEAEIIRLNRKTKQIVHNQKEIKSKLKTLKNGITTRTHKD